MDKTHSAALAAAKEVACATHPNDFAAATKCIGESSVSVLVTEMEEEAMVVMAMAMAKEATEAMVAMGMLPAMIMFP